MRPKTPKPEPEDRWRKPDYSDLPADCRPQFIDIDGVRAELWSAANLVRYGAELRRRRGRYAAACRWTKREGGAE